MARPKTHDEVVLGQLLLAAARDPEVMERLRANAHAILSQYGVRVPDNHEVVVFREREHRSVLVVPYVNGLAQTFDDMRQELLDEQAAYEETKKAVADHKKGAAGLSIEQAYARMIGHAAFGPRSR